MGSGRKYGRVLGPSMTVVLAVEVGLGEVG